MKINITEKINQTQNIDNLLNKKELELKEIDPSIIVETKEENSILYEKIESQSQPSVYNLLIIEKLKNESENLYEKVQKIVEDIITEQVKSEGSLQSLKNLDLNKSRTIDKEDLITINEKLNTEEVVEKIVELVKEISQEKIEKIDILIEAIDKGFQDVEKDLGQLPQISIKTYDKIRDKLNDLILMERFKNEPENVEVQIKEIIENIIVKQTRDNSSLENLRSLNKDNQILHIVDKVERKEVENTSEIILEFVKIGAEDDKKKLDSLIKIVEEAFEDREKSLGLLPSISKKTYNSTMEKLELEVDKYRYMGPFLFSGILNYEHWKRTMGIIDIKIYMVAIFILIILYCIIKILM